MSAKHATSEAKKPPADLEAAAASVAKCCADVCAAKESLGPLRQDYQDGEEKLAAAQMRQADAEEALVKAARNYAPEPAAEPATDVNNTETEKAKAAAHGLTPAHAPHAAAHGHDKK